MYDSKLCCTPGLTQVLISNLSVNSIIPVLIYEIMFDDGFLIFFYKVKIADIQFMCSSLKSATVMQNHYYYNIFLNIMCN